MLICLDEDCACFHHRLLDCMKKGENEETKFILEEFQDLSKITDSSGSTLLHYSAKYGNVEISRHLIDKGIDVDRQDSSGVSPLMLAVQNEKMETVDLLLKRNADIYMTDYSGVSSLEWAVNRRLNSSALVCLKQNSHLILELFFNMVNRDFLTRKVRLMQLLLKTNNSLKLVAAAIGRIELSNFILKNDNIIRHVERDLTALHWAMIFVKPDNIGLMIRRGFGMFGHYYWVYFAHLDEELKTLKMWLDDAVKKWPVSDLNRRNLLRDMVRLLKLGHKEIVRTILKSSVEAEVNFGFNRSLIHLLIINKHDDVMDVLEDLHIKFNANAVNMAGRTALMSAVENSCLKKVEFLLRHGAYVNDIVAGGVTALEIAMTNPRETGMEDVKIIELLLQYGADARLEFTNGQTIVNSLNFHKSSDIMKLVLAHFAWLRALGKLTPTMPALNMIEFQSALKTYFGMCVTKLQEMKSMEVLDGVTLFMLLTEKEENLVHYARNPIFMLAFNRIMENTPLLETYYSNTLQKRMAKALNSVELGRITYFIS